MNFSLINIPSEWYYHINLIRGKRLTSFYKISLYSVNYSRSIEKQLVISEGNNLYYFFCKYHKHNGVLLNIYDSILSLKYNFKLI